MPEADGPGVADDEGVDDEKPPLPLPLPLPLDGVVAVDELKDQTDKRDPPPQNSVLSPLQKDEQLP